VCSLSRTSSVSCGGVGGRDEDVDDGGLGGLGGIDGGATFNATGSHHIGPVILSATLAQVANGSEGMRAEVGLAYNGVTSNVALASGLSSYEAGSGLVAVCGKVPGSPTASELPAGR
jgi:outer membrane scaffolding protein for murein synthesis (MipA/OmpV family)